jgi:hypothetical protein
VVELKNIMFKSYTWIATYNSMPFSSFLELLDFILRFLHNKGFSCIFLVL